MRSIILVLTAIVGFSSLSFGQIKVADKAVIKTPTVQCDKCKEIIEFSLRREYGVTSVNVDIRKKTTTVTWLTDRTNLILIKAAISSLGYDADDMEADEWAYKRLPKECQKPAEKPVALPKKG